MGIRGNKDARNLIAKKYVQTDRQLCIMTDAIRVLYVDDEIGLLEIGKLFLESSGEFSITTISSAPAALDLLNKENFDVIVSDYQMPVMDGIQFLVEVRRCFGTIPFILFTGKGREEVVIQAINSGADFYLQKGGEPNSQFAELMHKIRSAALKKRADDKFLYINRLYSIISQINHVIIRTRDRNELFNTICQIAIKFGHFHMAWIGLLDENSDRIKPVAHAGYEKGYLDNIFITATENKPTGQGPTAAAFREGTVITSCDISTDSIMLPWREEALKRGYQSSAAVNFRYMDKPFGVLTLYATEPNFFTEDERNLLRDIGDDISYALDAISSETERRIVEKKLRENEEKYRTYIENSPEGIFIVDAAGNYLDANPSACSMVGYSREELLTLSIRDLNYHNSLKDSLPIFVELKKTGKLKVEFLLKKKNGEPIPVILNAVELPCEKYMAFCTDITEHKQYEQQISEHSHFLATLIDTLPISIFYKDVEGKYLGCNIPFEEYIGVTRSDLIGKTVYEIFPKDLADIYKAADQTVFENRIIQRYETELMFADGTRHDVIFYKAPFINNDGSVGGLIGTFLDITERKKAENALLESEQFTKEIIYNAKEGIIVYDRNFNYLVWNPFMELLTGITESEALGKNAFELFPHLQEQKVDILLQQALEGEIVRSPDIPYFVPKTKKSGWISGIYSPHFNGYGEIVGIIGIIRDITESKQFEEALDQANKKLNLLSEVNRHDINNKVIVIRGFLQLARKRKIIEEIEPFLDKIEHSLKVIENSIDFSKDYQDLGISKPKWVKLSTIVAIIGNPAIHVINETGSLQIFADSLFEKVLHNLIDNTIRHGETATEVHITVITDNDDIRIIWKDNGIGIPSDQKEMIFERGYGKNTGFGLFLTREILAITGMTMKETGIPGKGACFEITVPNGKWRYGSEGS